MNRFGIELKWASIITVFYCLWAFVEKSTGNHLDFKNIIILVFLFFLCMLVIGLLAFLDKKKNYYQNKWDYKQAFIFGVFLTGITALFNPIAHYIIYNSISPDYFSNLIAYQAAKGKMNQEILEETYNFDSTMYQSMRDILSFGIVISAILAYFLKTKNYTAPVKVIERKSKKKK